VGATFVARRMLDLVVLAIAVVTKQPELQPRSAARFPWTDVREGVRYFAPSGLRRLRPLAGMLRANRPWRLVAGLSKVLVGAFGSGALALATNTIWLFADTMGPWRMCATTVLSIGAMVTWLILDHELWERSPTCSIVVMRGGISCDVRSATPRNQRTCVRIRLAKYADGSNDVGSQPPRDLPVCTSAPTREDAPTGPPVGDHKHVVTMPPTSLCPIFAAFNTGETRGEPGLDLRVSRT
jgi:hypothetical protein